ncbi:hypothetical protein Aduo_018601 [Ancylostoma duodenale]
MSVVDRGNCAFRCRERGVCLLIDGVFHCACDDGRTIAANLSVLVPLSSKSAPFRQIGCESLWIVVSGSCTRLCTNVAADVVGIFPSSYRRHCVARRGHLAGFPLLSRSSFRKWSC